MFASLHSDIADPVKRIIAIHHSTNDAKRLGENSPLADTLKLAGALSPRFTKRLVNMYVDNKLTTLLPLKVNTVVSNVPGPPIDLYASGAKLVQYHGLGVLTPGVGLFHLVFSYMGDISFTVLADREMMPDPDFYRQCLQAAMDELKSAVENTSEEDIRRMIAEEMGLLARKPVADEANAKPAVAAKEKPAVSKPKAALKRKASSAKAATVDVAVAKQSAEPEKPAKSAAKKKVVRKRASTKVKESDSV
jgi:hypothetical protein